MLLSKINDFDNLIIIHAVKLSNLTGRDTITIDIPLSKQIFLFTSRGRDEMEISKSQVPIKIGILCFGIYFVSAIFWE